jgi:hypothetical protein
MPRPTPTGRPNSSLTPVIAIGVAAVLLVLVVVGLMVQGQRLANQVLSQRTVAVSVTDDNGNALNGATVTVEGSAASATTESTGVAHIGLGSLAPGIYTLVATDTGYVNTGAQFSISDSGNPPPIAIRMPWAPPLGTFVWQSRSTLWNVLVIRGGDPNYTLQGYQIEWHCYGENWSRSDVAVSLGTDQLTYGGWNVPMGPGTISTSFVRDGPLPKTSQAAPVGTCVNGQNAW